MDQTQLLLEYLKEQYTQARQHETLRTNSTAFLTAAAAAILGYLLKDGNPLQAWWVGLLIALIGAANWWINRAHFLGNRFHTTSAGKTRHALENAIGVWTVEKPTQIRAAALAEYGLRGPNISIGEKINSAIGIVPVGTAVLGLLVAVVSGYLNYEVLLHSCIPVVK